GHVARRPTLAYGRRTCCPQCSHETMTPLSSRSMGIVGRKPALQISDSGSAGLLHDSDQVVAHGCSHLVGAGRWWAKQPEQRRRFDGSQDGSITFGVGADAAGECRRDGNVPVQDLLRLMGVADLENAALPGKADAFAVHFLLEVMHAEDAELATLGDLGK